jgi:O-antigen/teichoic acid export membrane protein
MNYLGVVLGRKGFISGIHFSLVSLGFVLGQHIDVLLMGVLSTPENVALVRIAARVAEMAALMRAIVVLQYKPLMAEAYGKGEFELLQSHVSFMVKVFFITGIPVTLGLWFFAEQAMAVFGTEFVSGAWAMRVYIFGVFFLLLCGPCNAILAVTDNERKASKYVWTAIAINVVLDLILIPIYGAVGCGIANATSMVFVGVLSVKAARSHLKIDTTILSIFNKKQFTGD